MYDFMDSYARYSYEQLQLQQPHLKTDGIYKKGFEYFIICDSLDIQPLNQPDSSMVEVFNNQIKVLGCKMTLVTNLPDGVIKLESRTIEEAFQLSGNPFNVIDFNKHLALLLPRTFPKLWLRFNHESQGWDVAVEKNMTQSEIDMLQNKVSLLCGYEAKIDCKVTPNIKENFEREHQDPLSITVSKHSSINYSKSLMDKWEEDEQLWSDNKSDLFLGNQSQDSRSDKLQDSTCLINGKFGDAHNIRNYLTLFNEIQIVVPIESSYEKLLHSLDITEDELVKLTELNKVKLIFPQSIQRYSKKLLEKVSDINPQSIMLSRELAYRTVLDLKQRNPLAFLPLNTDEKQEVLSNLIGLSSKLKGTSEQRWFEGLAVELSNTWGHMYEFLSNRGAMGTFNVGLGPIINTTIKNFTGKDYFLETMGASQSIEWAAANQAVLCPVGPLARNEENFAYLYSGVRKDWEPNLVTSPNVATEGILTIANYVPVQELAETFTGKEIDQFRKLLIDLTHNKTSKEIHSIVEEFNKSVKAYEKKRKRMDTWDVKGITLDTALELTNMAIPFSGFITKQVGRLIEYSGDKNESVRKVMQKVQSKINRASPNAILVSRMRDKVKDLL